MTATQLTVFSAEPTLTASPSADQPNLPDGWRWVKLKEVTTIIMGQSPSSDTYNQNGDGLPFYQGKTEFGKVHPTVRKWCSVPGKIAEPNDILLSVRAPVGPTNLANQRCCIGRGLAAIRYNYPNAYKFLYYYFQAIQRELEQQGTGSTFAAISGDIVRGLNFPLPPLAEQQRIVAKIEELFSEIDAGIREVETALHRIKIYRQAIYHHFLNDEKWDRVKLGEIASVSGGITKNSKRGNLPLQVPYLRVANVYANRLDLTEIKDIGVAEAEIERTLLKFGDLLVVEGNGSIEQVGRVALWKAEIPYCLHQNHLIKIRFKDPAASTFLLTWLLSPLGRGAIERQASSTSGLHTLSISKIAGLVIPFPDLATQTQIVQQIEARLSEADALEKTLRTELQRAERLWQSVLKQAFSGGPTFRNLLKMDVPASLPA